MPEPRPSPALDPTEVLLTDPDSVARVGRALRRIARSVVGDEEVAEDIVQGAWVEVLERPPTAAGIGWLSSLVRSRSIDWLRRRGRSPRREALSDAHPAAGRDELGGALEIQRELLEAVDALREPYRSTVYLRYFESLSPRTIARRTGCPEKTVKTRLTRAHHLLRQRLAPDHRDARGAWSLAMLAYARPSALAPSAVLTAGALIMKQAAVAAVLLLAVLGVWIAVRSGPVDGSDSAAAEPGGSVEAPLDVTAQALGEAGPAAVQRSAEPVATLGTESPGAARAEGQALGALHVSVTAPDGAPAAGVAVIAERLTAGSRSGRTLFIQRTDASGVAHFDPHPPGTWKLACLRGGGEDRVEVVAGRTARCSVSLEPGVHVAGRVLDVDGVAVAGAEIWVARDVLTWTAGAVATRADAGGRFELADVAPSRSLGALAAGYLPSDLIDLDLVDTASGRVELELVVARGGGRASGSVRDARGTPIEGALVALSRAGVDSRPRRRLDSSSEETWSPRTARTGVAGRFHFDGLVPGNYAIEARRVGSAVRHGELQIRSGGDAVHDFVLLRGATVRGTVLDETGTPAAGALVLARTSPLSEEYLQNGQVDETVIFELPTVAAGPDGAFVLRDVPPGLAWLYALAPREPDARFGEVYPYERAQATLDPGAEHEWNPTLTRGRRIEGLALYRSGDPIVGQFAILEGSAKGSSRAVYMEDGRFEFIQLDPGPYRVRVQIFGLPEGASEPVLQNVFPDTGRIELRADFDPPAAAEPATVRVRLADTQEWPSPPSIALESMEPVSWVLGDEHEGTWEFQIDQPGSYRPIALLGERLVAAGETVTVSAGEDLLLPDLAAKPAGTIELDLGVPSGFTPRGLQGFLTNEAARRGENLELGTRTTLTLEHVIPGIASLTLIGENIQRQELELIVVAGETTRVTDPLIPAVPVPFRLAWSTAQQEGPLTYRFLDRTTGATLTERSLEDLPRYTPPLEWQVQLPLGAYTFELELDGEFHTEPFEVTSLDPTEAPRLGQDR